MLSSELIQKANSLFFRTRRRVTDVFAGEYESAFKGSGMAFEEFREYAPGDDIRQIDWNVTARMDKPFVKQFREEREQTLFFLVDVSKSLDFGQGRTKREVVAEIAALLAFAALKTQDKTGLILFSDQVEHYLPPKKGRAHVWNIVSTVLEAKSHNRQTKISEAVRFFMNVTRRKATCFLLSDFWDADYLESLRILRYKHELVTMRVLDELEISKPSGVLMDWQDLETGGVVSVDGRLPTQEGARPLAHTMAQNDIDFLDVTTHEDYLEALLKFFIQREKRR